MTSTQVQKVREHLLPETLAFATANSGFYAERLAPLLSSIRSVEDLRLLPTIERQDLIRYGSDMLTSREFPASVSMSTGTTHKPGDLSPPPFFCRSEDEIALCKRLKERLLRGTPLESELRLQIVNCAHGRPYEPTSPGTLSVGFDRPFHLACMAAMLRRSYNFAGFPDRIHVLSGSLNTIKLIAASIDTHDPELWSDSKIRTLMVGGSFLTSRWRHLLQTWFNASLVNLYGLSEVPMSSCAECPSCLGFHLPPLVIPEVLSIYTGEVIIDGYGELVLTTLYPFTKLQPLIRYRTGDLVRLLPHCDIQSERAIRPIGRLAHTMIDRPNRALIPSSLLHELLDGLPDLNRALFPSIATFEVKACIGVPRYTVHLLNEHPHTPGFLVEVETVYDPRQFPTRTAELKKMLETEIALLTIVDQRSRSLPVKVDVLSAGTLTGTTEIIKP